MPLFAAPAAAHNPCVPPSASLSAACFGIIAALREELGDLDRHEVARHSASGLEIHELAIAGQRVLATVGGIGKVCAARAAAVLLERGATRGLLVVGTCGGLTKGLSPGHFVHCKLAIQTDFAARAGREVASDGRLFAAWQSIVPGTPTSFLTADRPVLSTWRRLRLRKAFQGACVAEMETAAVASVASLAGVPWAALRVVTDNADHLGLISFKLNFPELAARAAATVPALLESLSVAPPSAHER